MRLDKFITCTMNVSRSDAKKIIRSSKVFINDLVCTKGDSNVNDNDVVMYLGNELNYKENIYIMMNKPQGYVCAKKDNVHNTVIDLINEDEYNLEKLIIIGRLDIDTEGLLLITTDGMLTHTLTSPKHDHYKKYYVHVDGTFKEEDMLSFEKGITIDDDGEEYTCKKALLEIIDSNKAYISISEGRFHQIKKMCYSIGLEVTYLKRIQIGYLKLDEKLASGEYRELTDEEIKMIK